MNGNVRAVETLKQRLESGEEVDLLSESDLCTVASLLKRYLRDLPVGLVDSTVQQALIQHHQGKRKSFFSNVYLCASLSSIINLPTQVDLKCTISTKVICTRQGI